MMVTKYATKSSTDEEQSESSSKDQNMNGFSRGLEQIKSYTQNNLIITCDSKRVRLRKNTSNKRVKGGQVQTDLVKGSQMHNYWSAIISQQKRTCKIMQDSCKIVQESDLHGTCTRYVPFARSCTYLARIGARFCKRCCKNNYGVSCTFFCKILQELCKIVQESCKKRDISRARAKQVLHARFLHNLA